MSPQKCLFDAFVCSDNQNASNRRIGSAIGILKAIAEAICCSPSIGPPASSSGFAGPAFEPRAVMTKMWASIPICLATASSLGFCFKSIRIFAQALYAEIASGRSDNGPSD